MSLILRNVSKITKTSSSLPMRGRPIMTTPVLNQPRSLVKLRRLQAHFQCEDGRPIWLKAGFSDRILYTSTILSCFLGIFMVLSTIYDHAKPPSWKTSTC